MHIRQMDAASARLVIEWRYEPPYDMYNIDSADIEANVSWFADPRNGYYSVINDDEALVAFCCFGAEAQVPGGDYRNAALDMGLGVRPDLVGQGRGAVFVATLIDFACQAFAPSTVRVTVAAFNSRALRVWQQAGFMRVQQFSRPRDGMAFIILTREETAV